MTSLLRLVSAKDLRGHLLGGLPALFSPLSPIDTMPQHAGCHSWHPLRSENHLPLLDTTAYGCKDDASGKIMKAHPLHDDTSLRMLLRKGRTRSGKQETHLFWGQNWQMQVTFWIAQLMDILEMCINAIPLLPTEIQKGRKPMPLWGEK